MSLDLNATGAKVVAGSGGGTSAGDPLVQTVQVSQTTLGAIPVSETNLEAAAGTTADASWVGSGVASLVAVLKSIALRLGVGASVNDGSGTLAAGGTAQNIFGGVIPTNGYLIQNNHASATLYVSDVGTAAATGASLALAPGTILVTPGGYKPPNAVSVFGNTSGQPWTARRW